MLYFVISGLGSEKETRVELEMGEYTLGRAQNSDILIQDKSISRNHARIIYNETCVKLIDLDSSNGIFVNGVKVSETILYNGDMVTVKNVKIDVESEFDKNSSSDKWSYKEEYSKNEKFIEENGFLNELESKAFRADNGNENQFSVDATGSNDPHISVGFDDNIDKESFFSKASSSKNNEDSIFNIKDKSISLSNLEGEKSIKPSYDQKAKTSLFENLGKAIKNILNGFEEALIKPIVTVILHFEYRMIVILLMTFCVGFITYFVLFPQKINMENYLRKEALSHAETIALFLAKFNRNELINNNYGQLNIGVAMEIPNVQGARIIRRDGKIVAPIQERLKDASTPHLVFAVQAMMKGQTADIKGVKPNVYSVVSPIKAFTQDNYNFYSERISNIAEEEIIGLAQIEYSTDSIFTGNPYEAITTFSFLKQILFSLIIGFFFSFLIIRLIVPVFKNMKKDVQDSIKSGKSLELKNYVNLKELDEFVQTLKQYVAKDKSDRENKKIFPDPFEVSGEGNSGDTIEAYKCVLKLIDQGLIVIDTAEQIVLANDAFAIQMQYGSKDSVEGQPMQNVIQDIDTYERVRELISNIDSSSETRVVDTVEISGFETSVMVSKSDSGNFIAILFKEINT